MQRRSVPVILLAGSAVAVAAGVFLVRQNRVPEPPNEPIRRDSIVMLGDSITEEGRWGTLLPEWPVVNRGRSGFTTMQLVSVAQEVASGHPRMVVILTGTNDIRDGRPPSWTIEYLTAIVDALESGSPTSRIVVQTILPRSDASDAVNRANESIRRLADDRGLRLLDLHAVFDDGTGGLRTGDTRDGVHLTPVGYERWAAELARRLPEIDER